jgi:endoglycosylceramidase
VKCVPAALVALVAALAVAPAADGALVLPLSHAGRWTTDAQGRVVVLHGMNMVSKRPPYAPDAVGFDDDDAAFLAAEGFNTVRVGIIYKAVEPAPAVYDDAYLARIAQTVDTLGRHGIVSTLDFHQDLYNERFQGEGWPDWAVLDDGLPAQPQGGFPANYLIMPALQRAFDHFWANDPGPGGVGLGDRYAAAWRHVAERFRSDTNVLGYELLNEPWPGSTWQQCANPAGCPVFDAQLTTFVKRSVAAIRQADPRTLVWYEPNVIFNDGADTNLGAIGDPHAGFAFHDYCLSAGGSNSNNGCDSFDDLVFANALKRAQSTGDALLMSEWGATDAPDILTAMLERADRNMIGWQEWQYCGCDDPTTAAGPGPTQAIVIDPAKPPQGDNIKAAKLKLLARPYPQAIAGTPESYGFAADTGTFTLRYTTRRADGAGDLAGDVESEVLLPARQYPAGYAVTVEGASVHSAPGSPVLRVAACAGAREVAVTVAPTGPSHATCTPPAPPARPARRTLGLSVRVRPRTAIAGRRTTLHVRVLLDGRPAAGVRVALGRRRATTGRRGRASLRVRLTRPGRRVLAATGPGGARGRATVRVVRARTRRGSR